MVTKQKKREKQNLINILTSSYWKIHLFEKSRTFLFALIDTLLVEWMLPVFSQAAWRWRDSFFPFTKNNNKTSQERKKEKKGKGAAESQATYSSLNIGFHGNKFGSLWRLNNPMQSNASSITFVWSTFLWPPLSPSSSFLLSNKTGVTKMKKSFNKLAELGLNQSLLKPFYCHQQNLDEALTA